MDTAGRGAATTTSRRRPAVRGPVLYMRVMASPTTSPGNPPVFGSARLTEEVVLDALIGTSPILRYRWVIIPVVAALMIFVVPPVEGSETRPWLNLIPMLTLAVVLGVVLLRGPRRNARRLLAALSAEQGESDYRLDGEGLTIRAPGSSATVAYRVIDRYRETRLAFLVYTSPSVANIVPKGAFGAADLERVRALLATNVRQVGRPVEEAR